MAGTTNEIGTAPDLTITLVDKLLDWPFLFFLLIAVIFLLARSEFFALLSKRQVTVKVGGNEVTIGDAIETLADKTSVSVADIEALQTQIDALKPSIGTLSSADESSLDTTDTPAADVVERLRNGLENSSYTWRSVERLALQAGISENRAHELLANQPDVKIGRGKSGRVIAKLRN